MDLQSHWDVNVALLRDLCSVPYRFLYDPDGHKISIRPCENISSDPSEYPEKASPTSELLMLLTAISQSDTLLLRNIETVLRSYPLSKLFLDLMDSHTFNIANVRINTADFEEWDYINPTADEKFRSASLS
jgi:hypothetical protein